MTKHEVVLSIKDMEKANYDENSQKKTLFFYFVLESNKKKHIDPIYITPD